MNKKILLGIGLAFAFLMGFVAAFEIHELYPTTIAQLGDDKFLVVHERHVVNGTETRYWTLTGNLDGNTISTIKLDGKKHILIDDKYLCFNGDNTVTWSLEECR